MIHLRRFGIFRGCQSGVVSPSVAGGCKADPSPVDFAKQTVDFAKQIWPGGEVDRPRNSLSRGLLRSRTGRLRHFATVPGIFSPTDLDFWWPSSSGRRIYETQYRR